MQTYDTEGIKAQAGRFSPDTETCPFGLLYLFNDISKRKKSQNDERENDMDQAKVGVIMGSTSDWETMRHACHVLQELKIAYEKKWYPLIEHRMKCLPMPNRPKAKVCK